MLTEALANLKEAAVVPELRVDTHTHFSSTPYGFRQLVRYLSSTNQTRNMSEYMLLGRLPDDEGETAAMLLTAVTKAEFPAQSLTLYGKQTPLHHESLTRIADSVTQLQCTMSQLKKLALTIGCVHKMNIQDIKTLGSLMKAAPIEEVLELEFITGCCGARKSLIPPNVLAALRSNAVKTLRITGAVLRQQDLCATLYHHKESLRALTLRHISIMPRDSFAAVFDWIQQQFSIDALTLHWLQHGYDHMDETTGRGAEYTFDDGEGVKAGLRLLSRSATFGDPPIPHAKLFDQKNAARSVVPDTFKDDWLHEPAPSGWTVWGPRMPRALAILEACYGNPVDDEVRLGAPRLSLLSHASVHCLMSKWTTTTPVSGCA
ncbi:hypothetical protein Slin14017_G102210 [Septoria linicola]|nr:hypothetical protein Slin14017_G102210 [Septoria linicola]